MTTNQAGANKHAQLIQDNKSLAQAIDILSTASVLAVDTEFMRERTFHAQLCLLQLATENDAFLVDPLADVDLNPLCEVLCNHSIQKVFHAGYQDLQILFELFGKTVAPIFDTQIAAALIGLPQQLSLVAIVKRYADVELKKVDTFSDWSKRPLRHAQIEYALDDVRYLPQVYASMRADLESAGRVHWLDEEFANMSNQEQYVEKPELLWHKIKGSSGLSRRQLGILQELAIWRDQEARTRNLPRKWVVADEQLIDITRRSPSNRDELFMTRGLQDRVSRRMTTGILAAVTRGLQKDEESLPIRSSKPIRGAGFTASMDMMQTMVHYRAAEHHIAGNILAANDELQALASGRREGLRVLSGWRREMIGNELLELLAGSISLSIQAGQLRVESKDATKADEVL
ncbi:MAG: ribonuclease D [Coriobacteriia bacterium]|nr:ribonuclease D [Coriobacteriia bacterium]